MERFNRALAAALAAALCLAGVQAFAVEEPALAIPEIDWNEPVTVSDNGLPDVQVLNVSVSDESLAGGVFTSGATLKGMATVSNPSDRPAEATFEVTLVSRDGEGTPLEVYAADYGGDIFSLAPGETADVPFSIDVPSGINAQNVSVRAWTRLVGSIYLGWSYSEPFDVVGQGGAAAIDSAYYTLADGQEVAPTTGPTLYEDAPRDALPLSVVLRGQGSALSLTPVVTFKNRAEGGAGVTWRLEAVDVPADGTALATVPFSHADQNPGVYEGEISWVDAAGAERAPRLGFRYVVAGQVATVHSVSSSADTVTSGQEFRVTLSLSGAPIDLMSADRSRKTDASRAQVFVEISDELGNVVAKGSQTEILPTLGQMSFDFKARRAARGMTANVSILDSEGKEIFSRSYPISAGGTAPSDGAGQARVVFSIAAAISALLLAAAFLMWRGFRHRAALVAVLLAAGAWSFACYSIVSAGGYVAVTGSVNPGWVGCTGPNIYVNSPSPGSSVSCGGGFLAEAYVQYSYCANSNNQGSTQLWLQRQGYGALQYSPVRSYFNAGWEGNHSAAYFDGVARMSIGGGNLATNGNYGLGVSSSATIAADGCSWSVSGVSRFTVSGCDVCLNMDGVQATVPSDRFKDTAGDTAGNCYTVDAPTACAVDSLRTEIGAAATWTATGCDDTCVWEDGSTGATHSVTITAAGDTAATVKSRKTVTGSDGNVATKDSAAVTCETTASIVDVCPFLNGAENSTVQTEVPNSMVRNAGGDCVCPTGTTYDSVDGRCEDSHGLCSTCGVTVSSAGSPGESCGDGVCDEDESCGSCAADCGECAACPIESENQYCVEIFGRDGARTGAFESLDLDELERAFGFKIPDAARDLRAAVGAGSPSYPIWGAVGRGVGGVNYASSGCGGALCTYGVQGCLTTVDPRTNLSVAKCDPVNDITGRPTAILEVEPSVVGIDGSCSLYWSSSKMVSCAIEGRGVSSTLLAGTAKTPPLQASATYTLSCTDADDRTYSDSDTCAVSPDVVEF